MSIKDLFGRKTVVVQSAESASVDAESSRYILRKQELQKTFVPPVNFATASNFIRFGSAEEYYEASVRRVYSEYPYDGSEAEKILYELSSSYFDNWILKELYPKSTGYGTFNIDGYGPSSKTNGYGLNSSTSDYEYISIGGGVRVAPQNQHDPSLDDPRQSLHSKFKNGTAWAEGTDKTSAFQFTAVSGSTIEFWMKKNSFNKATTEKEVIFDIYNGELSSSYKYGRITLELFPDSSDENPFRLTYQHGSVGVFQQSLASGSSFTIDEVADGKWHHWAVTTRTRANSAGTNFVDLKFYKDGIVLNQQSIATTSSVGSSQNIGNIGGRMDAHIGALIAPVWDGKSGTMQGAKYAGKLSASIDDFRFWKRRVGSHEIYNNWYHPIGGGGNTDEHRETLALYYKFNEGITTTASVDSVVLDYSGRVANGNWTGYTANSRNTGSCFVSASVIAYEPPDPIIRWNNPQVKTLITNLQSSGSNYDVNNTSFMYDMVPFWMREEDLEFGDVNLKKMYQIIASYFDTLYLQIQSLPDLKAKKYFPMDEQPYPFAKELLEHNGLIVPDLFIAQGVLEKFYDRDDQNLKYERDMDDLKTRIYYNIYNNLKTIYESKGTEKSYRNMLRCFGIDDEIVKLNLYTDNGVNYLTDKIKYSSHKTKFLNNNTTYNFTGRVYNTSSVDNPRTFISSSGPLGSRQEKNLAFTMEADIIVPVKYELGTELYFPTDFLTSSVMGFHSASADNPHNFSWHVGDGTDQSNLQVHLVRPVRESKDAKFVITNAAKTIFAETELLKDIYSNERWALGLKVYPDGYPFIGTVATASNPSYTAELYGVTHNLQDVQREFTITASMSYADGSAMLSNTKRFYAGCEAENFTGSAKHPSDLKIAACRLWYDKLDNAVLKQHNLDASNYGHNKVHGNPTPYVTGLENQHIPSAEVLAFNWDFQQVTASDGNGRFVVEDFSSGTSANRYGWIDDLILRNNRAGGMGWLAGSKSVVDNEFIFSAKKELPEISFTSDGIFVKGDEEIMFSTDEDTTDNVFAFEKSMYQVLSEEVLKTFSTVTEYANLFMKPVDHYREENKRLDHFKELYFQRVDGDLDFERFTNYFKFIDSTVSVFIQQLHPAMAKFNEGISDMVESHILERPKYKRQFPFMTTRDTVPSGKMSGVGERVYNWRQGHAPPARHARASIVISDAGGISHGDTFTLIDSAGVSTTYIINGGVAQADGGGSGGSATVGFLGVGGGVAGKALAANAIAIAINATTDANYTAVSNGVDEVGITQGSAGAHGNRTNTDSIGHTTVSNFEGGTGGDENVNCFWQKERRAEKPKGSILPSGARLNELRNVIVSEVDGTAKNLGTTPSDYPTNVNKPAIYQGSTYAVRSFGRQYRFTYEEQKTIHGGTNYGHQKNRDFALDHLKPHGLVGNSGVPQEVLAAGLGKGDGVLSLDKCKDTNEPYETDSYSLEHLKKAEYQFDVIVGRYADTSNGVQAKSDEVSTVFRVKSHRGLPFNIVSGTIGTGYNKKVFDNFDDDFILTNLHSDTTTPSNDVPMQGPFTEAWVGGRQFRHTPLNRYNKNLKSVNTDSAHLGSRRSLSWAATTEEFVFGESTLSSALSTTSKFSFSFWLKLGVDSSNTEKMIFQMDPEPLGGVNFGMRFYIEEDDLRMSARPGGNKYVIRRWENSVPNDEWAQWIIEIDPTVDLDSADFVKVYKNNSLLAVTSGPTAESGFAALSTKTLVDKLQVLRLGDLGNLVSHASRQNYELQGELQDFAIWNKSLSASDRNLLYNGGNSIWPDLAPSGSAITNWWTLGEEQAISNLPIGSTIPDRFNTKFTSVMGQKNSMSFPTGSVVSIQLGKAGHLHNTPSYLDDAYSRPEAFRILLGDHPSELYQDGALGMVGPDYGGPYPQTERRMALHYRDERAKRPLNIRNIRTNLSSSLLGNFKENYEIVSIVGRSDNNSKFREFVDVSSSLQYRIGAALPATTNQAGLFGVVPFVTGNVFGGKTNITAPSHRIKRGQQDGVIASGSLFFNDTNYYHGGSLASGSFTVSGSSVLAFDTGSFVISASYASGSHAQGKFIIGYPDISTSHGKINFTGSSIHGTKAKGAVKVGAMPSLTVSTGSFVLGPATDFGDVASGSVHVSAPPTYSTSTGSFVLAPATDFGEPASGSVTVGTPPTYSTATGSFTLLPATTFGTHAAGSVTVGAPPTYTNCTGSFNLDPATTFGTVSKGSVTVGTPPSYGVSSGSFNMVGAYNAPTTAVNGAFTVGSRTTYQTQYTGSFQLQGVPEAELRSYATWEVPSKEDLLEGETFTVTAGGVSKTWEATWMPFLYTDSDYKITTKSWAGGSSAGDPKKVIAGAASATSQIAIPSGIRAHLNTDFALSFWIKANGSTWGNQYFRVYDGSNSSDFMIHSNGNITLKIYDSNGNNDTATFAASFTNNTTWKHIVVNWPMDSLQTTAPRMWLDGTELSSTGWSTSTFDANYGSVSSSNWFISNGWQAREFAVYNGLLSPSDAKEIYNGGKFNWRGNDNVVSSVYNPNWIGFQSFNKLLAYYRMRNDTHDEYGFSPQLGSALADTEGDYDLDDATNNIQNDVDGGSATYWYESNSHQLTNTQLWDQIKSDANSAFSGYTCTYSEVSGALDTKARFHLIKDAADATSMSVSRVDRTGKELYFLANDQQGFACENYKGLENTGGYNSFSYWVRPTDVTGTFIDFIAYDGPSSANDFVFQVRREDDDLMIFLFNTASNYKRYDVTGAFTNNTWHHVIVAWNHTNIATAPTIHINGVNQTISNTTTIGAGTGAVGGDFEKIYVGSFMSTYGYSPKARIADLAIWKADITANSSTLYNNGQRLEPWNYKDADGNEFFVTCTDWWFFGEEHNLTHLIDGDAFNTARTIDGVTSGTPSQIGSVGRRRNVLTCRTPLKITCQQDSNSRPVAMLADSMAAAAGRAAIASTLEDGDNITIEGDTFTIKTTRKELYDTKTINGGQTFRKALHFPGTGGIYSDSSAALINDSYHLEWDNDWVAFSGWFKWAGYNSDYKTIIDYVPSSGERILLRLRNDDIYFFVDRGTNSDSYYRFNFPSANDREWYHFVWVVPKTAPDQTPRFYLNGALETITNIDSDPSEDFDGGTAGTFAIGGYTNNSATRGFGESIQDIAVWKNQLDGEDAAILYNSGSWFDLRHHPKAHYINDWWLLGKDTTGTGATVDSIASGSALSSGGGVTTIDPVVGLHPLSASFASLVYVSDGIMKTRQMDSTIFNNLKTAIASNTLYEENNAGNSTISVSTSGNTGTFTLTDTLNDAPTAFSENGEGFKSLSGPTANGADTSQPTGGAVDGHYVQIGSVKFYVDSDNNSAGGNYAESGGHYYVYSNAADDATWWARFAAAVNAGVTSHTTTHGGSGVFDVDADAAGSAGNISIVGSGATFSSTSNVAGGADATNNGTGRGIRFGGATGSLNGGTDRDVYVYTDLTSKVAGASGTVTFIQDGVWLNENGANRHYFVSSTGSSAGSDGVSSVLWQRVTASLAHGLNSMVGAPAVTSSPNASFRIAPLAGSDDARIEFTGSYTITNGHDFALSSVSAGSSGPNIFSITDANVNGFGHPTNNAYETNKLLTVNGKVFEFVHPYNAYAAAGSNVAIRVTGSQADIVTILHASMSANVPDYTGFQVDGSVISFTSSHAGTSYNNDITDSAQIISAITQTAGGTDETGAGHHKGLKFTLGTGGRDVSFFSTQDMASSSAPSGVSLIANGVAHRVTPTQYYISTTGSTGTKTNGVDADYWNRWLVALRHATNSWSGQEGTWSYVVDGDNANIRFTGSMPHTGSQDAQSFIFNLQTGGATGNIPTEGFDGNFTGRGHPTDNDYQSNRLLTVNGKTFEFVHPHNNYAVTDAAYVGIRVTGSQADIVTILNASMSANVPNYTGFQIDGNVISFTASHAGTAYNGHVTDQAKMISSFVQTAGGTNESGAGHHTGFTFELGDGGARRYFYPTQDIASGSGDLVSNGVKRLNSGGFDRYFISTTGSTGSKTNGVNADYWNRWLAALRHATNTWTGQQGTWSVVEVGGNGQIRFTGSFGVTGSHDIRQKQNTNYPNNIGNHPLLTWEGDFTGKGHPTNNAYETNKLLTVNGKVFEFVHPHNNYAKSDSNYVAIRVTGSTAQIAAILHASMSANVPDYTGFQSNATTVAFTSSAGGTSFNGDITDNAEIISSIVQTAGGTNELGAGHNKGIAIQWPVGPVTQTFRALQTLASGSGALVSNGVMKDGNAYFISTSGSTGNKSDGVNIDYWNRWKAALEHGTNAATSDSGTWTYSVNGSGDAVFSFQGGYSATNQHDGNIILNVGAGNHGNNPVMELKGNLKGYGYPSDNSHLSEQKLQVDGVGFEFVHPYNNYAEHDVNNIAIRMTGSRADIVTILHASMSANIPRYTGFQVDGNTISFTSSVGGALYNGHISETANIISISQQTTGGTNESGAGHLKEVRLSWGAGSKRFRTVQTLASGSGTLLSNGVMKDSSVYWISTSGATGNKTDGVNTDYWNRWLSALQHGTNDLTGDSGTWTYLVDGTNAEFRFTGSFDKVNTHDAFISTPLMAGAHGEDVMVTHRGHIKGYGKPPASYRTGNGNYMVINGVNFENVYPYNDYAFSGSSTNVRIRHTGSLAAYASALATTMSANLLDGYGQAEYTGFGADSDTGGYWIGFTASNVDTATRSYNATISNLFQGSATQNITGGGKHRGVYDHFSNYLDITNQAGTDDLRIQPKRTVTAAVYAEPTYSFHRDGVFRHNTSGLYVVSITGSSPGSDLSQAEWVRRFSNTFLHAVGSLTGQSGSIKIISGSAPSWNHQMEFTGSDFNKTFPITHNVAFTTMNHGDGNFPTSMTDPTGYGRLQFGQYEYNTADRQWLQFANGTDGASQGTRDRFEFTVPHNNFNLEGTSDHSIRTTGSITDFFTRVSSSLGHLDKYTVLHHTDLGTSPCHFTIRANYTGSIYNSDITANKPSPPQQLVPAVGGNILTPLSGGHGQYGILDDNFLLVSQNGGATYPRKNHLFRLDHVGALHPLTNRTHEFNIKVHNDGGGSKFYPNGELVTGSVYVGNYGKKQGDIVLVRGSVYRFKQSDASNYPDSGGGDANHHPIVFHTAPLTSSGAGALTGVTSSWAQNDETPVRYINDGSDVTYAAYTAGLNGNANDYVEISCSATTPERLFYGCGNHGNMGGAIYVISASAQTYVDSRLPYNNAWNNLQTAITTEFPRLNVSFNDDDQYDQAAVGDNNDDDYWLKVEKALFKITGSTNTGSMDHTLLVTSGSSWSNVHQVTGAMTYAGDGIDQFETFCLQWGVHPDGHRGVQSLRYGVSDINGNSPYEGLDNSQDSTFVELDSIFTGSEVYLADGAVPVDSDWYLSSSILWNTVSASIKNTGQFYFTTSSSPDRKYKIFSLTASYYDTRFNWTGSGEFGVTTRGFSTSSNSNSFNIWRPMQGAVAPIQVGSPTDNSYIDFTMGAPLNKHVRIKANVDGWRDLEDDPLDTIFWDYRVPTSNGTSQKTAVRTNASGAWAKLTGSDGVAFYQVPTITAGASVRVDVHATMTGSDKNFMTPATLYGTTWISGSGHINANDDYIGSHHITGGVTFLESAFYRSTLNVNRREQAVMQDGRRQKTIFTSRFYGGGGPEVMTEAFLDVHAKEKSVYSSLPYRNLLVKNDSGEGARNVHWTSTEYNKTFVKSLPATIRVNSHAQRREGLNTLHTRHAHNGGLDSKHATTGPIPATVKISMTALPANGNQLILRNGDPHYLSTGGADDADLSGAGLAKQWWITVDNSEGVDTTSAWADTGGSGVYWEAVIDITHHNTVEKFLRKAAEFLRTRPTVYADGTAVSNSATVKGDQISWEVDYTVDTLTLKSRFDNRSATGDDWLATSNLANTTVTKTKWLYDFQEPVIGGATEPSFHKIHRNTLPRPSESRALRAPQRVNSTTGIITGDVSSVYPADGYISIAFWAKLDEHVETNRSKFVLEADNNDNHNSLIVSFRDNKLVIDFYDGTENQVNEETYRTSPLNNTTVWNQYVLIYNSDDMSEAPVCYINAEPQTMLSANRGGTGAVQQIAGRFVIMGNDSRTHASELQGSLQDLAILGTQVTQLQVNEMHDAHDLSKTSLLPHIIDYWKLGNVNVPFGTQVPVGTTIYPTVGGTSLQVADFIYSIQGRGKDSRYDNYYVQSILPQSDYNYSWVESTLGSNYSVRSGKQKVFGYWPKDGILIRNNKLGAKGTYYATQVTASTIESAINFPTGSEIHGS